MPSQQRTCPSSIGTMTNYEYESKFMKKNPDVDLAAESFDTDAAIDTGDADVAAVLGEEDAAEDLPEDMD